MQLSDINETFLDDIRVGPNDQDLLDHIRTYYRDSYFMRLQKPSAALNRNFLIFCYNLANMGLRREAAVMLVFVEPDYYTTTFLNDIKEAAIHLQAAEDLKNRIDAKSKEQAAYHRSMAEYVEVATGVIEFVMLRLISFPGKTEFLAFLRTLQADPIKLVKRPVISLVK